MYCMNSVWLFSYHFIANSTSCLNVSGFCSVPLISWIESVGVGRVRGRYVRRWGGLKAIGSLKQLFRLKK